MKCGEKEISDIEMAPYKIAPIFSGGVHMAYLHFSADTLKNIGEDCVKAILSGKFGVKQWSQEVSHL